MSQVAGYVRVPQPSLDSRLRKIGMERAAGTGPRALSAVGILGGARSNRVRPTARRMAAVDVEPATRRPLGGRQPRVRQRQQRGRVRLRPRLGAICRGPSRVLLLPEARFGVPVYSGDWTTFDCGAG